MIRFANVSKVLQTATQRNVISRKARPRGTRQTRSAFWRRTAPAKTTLINMNRAGSRNPMTGVTRGMPCFVPAGVHWAACRLETFGDGEFALHRRLYISTPTSVERLSWLCGSEEYFDMPVATIRKAWARFSFALLLASRLRHLPIGRRMPTTDGLRVQNKKAGSLPCASANARPCIILPTNRNAGEVLRSAAVLRTTVHDVRHTEEQTAFMTTET